MCLDKIIKAIKVRILTWRPKTQYQSLSPIIWANEIFGLRILEFGDRLRYSWSIIYISVCIVLYYILYNIMLRSEKYWPMRQRIIYKFLLYVNIAIIFICIVFGCVTTKVRIYTTNY